MFILDVDDGDFDDDDDDGNIDDNDVNDLDDNEIPAQMVNAGSCMISHGLKALFLDYIDLISCYYFVLRLPNAMSRRYKDPGIAFHNPNFDRLVDLTLKSVYIRIATLDISNDEDGDLNPRGFNESITVSQIAPTP